MRIGINIASYLPLAAWFPGKAVRAAKAAGYEFLQVLPLRGLWSTSRGNSRVVNEKILSSLPVEYLEKPWNTAQSLTQVVIDKARKSAGAPTLLDYAIFPTAERAALLYDSLQNLYGVSNRPRVIGHEFAVWSNLVEVHPGLWLTVDEIIKKASEMDAKWRDNDMRVCQSSQPLVLDLWHLRHDATSEWISNKPAHVTSGSLLGRWQQSLPKLLPFSKVIHVSPSRNTTELQSCLRGEPTELGEMIKCIRQYGWDGDLVVEATLGLRGFDFDHLSRVLADFRGWLAEEIKMT